MLVESNSLELDETPSYSASHSDPSCLHMELVLSVGLTVHLHCKDSFMHALCAEDMNGEDLGYE